MKRNHKLFVKDILDCIEKIKTPGYKARQQVSSPLGFKENVSKKS